jgi:hypothetical protein
MILDANCKYRYIAPVLGGVKSERTMMSTRDGCCESSTQRFATRNALAWVE